MRRRRLLKRRIGRLRGRRLLRRSDFSKKDVRIRFCKAVVHTIWLSE